MIAAITAFMLVTELDETGTETADLQSERTERNARRNIALVAPVKVRTRSRNFINSPGKSGVLKTFGAVHCVVVLRRATNYLVGRETTERKPEQP